MAGREILSAEQLGREAESAYRSGDFVAAERAFIAAAESYAAAGNETLAAEMRNNCSVVLLAAGQPERALLLADTCAAVFAGLHDDRRQALALGNRAAALESLNRLPEALAAYEQSAEMLKILGEFELRSYVMQAISKLQFRSGQQLQALATMQAGVEAIPRPNLKQRLLKRLLRLPMSYLGNPGRRPPSAGST